jgi:hypothetical protein
MEQPVFGECVDVDPIDEVRCERVEITGPAEDTFDIATGA